MKQKDKFKLDEKGQALIEFIMFVPFLLILYSITLTLGAAVNGSINQQKITRGYFFSRVKHNSMAPTQINLQSLGTLGSAGLVVFGWMEKFASGTDLPKAPCYKMRSLLNADPSDSCDTTYDQATQFIRVSTVYGLCGATYANINSPNQVLTHVSGNSSSCTNQN